MPKSLSSRDVIRMLRADGWELKSVEGDHHKFKHPLKAGRVIVTHPRKDIPTGTLRAIYRQAGWEWRERR